MAAARGARKFPPNFDHFLECPGTEALAGAKTSWGQMNRPRPQVSAGLAAVQKSVPPCAQPTLVAKKDTRHAHALFRPPLSECTRCTYKLGSCVQLGTHTPTRIRLLAWDVRLGQTAEQSWHSPRVDPLGQKGTLDHTSFNSGSSCSGKGQNLGEGPSLARRGF